MDMVLKTVLSMSLSGSLLILAFLVAKSFLRDKVSRQWQYYIWLIVILRLLVPFEPEISLMGRVRQSVDSFYLWESEREAGKDASLSGLKGLSDVSDSNTIGNAKGINLFKDGAGQGREAAGWPGTFKDWRKRLWEQVILLSGYLWAVWLAAGAGLLIRKATMYQSFIRYVKAGAVPVSDIEILERLSALIAQEHIGRPVELWLNPLISSPMLTGLLHPCIILPDMAVSEKNFRYIVLHELTHCKRRDIVYKWLVQFAVCLHWFNPLVHLMSREIEKACEFSCDEAVLAKTGSGNAKGYGETLLDAMASAGKRAGNSGAVTLSENRELLKARLKAIMNYRKKSKITAVLTGALTLGIISGTFLIGVYPVEAAPAFTEENVFATSGKNKETAPGPNRAEGMPSESGYDEKTALSEPDKTGKQTAFAQVQKYYEAGSIPLFDIAFSRMEEEQQEEWLDKIYKDGNVSFFSVIRYLQVDSAVVQRFAEKAYADSSASFFSIAAGCMSEDALEAWLERALEDENIKFQSILYEKLDREEELDALEAELTARQQKEYESFGIIMDGKICYYENQRVHVFLDIRANRSFYTLNIDPQGTVSIRVSRNQKDEIEGVAYMTDEEVEALLTDKAGE